MEKKKWHKDGGWEMLKDFGSQPCTPGSSLRPGNGPGNAEALVEAHGPSQQLALMEGGPSPLGNYEPMVVK